MKPLPLLLLALLVSPGWGAEPDPLDNWPHWRGPEANGNAPRANPPIKWDAKTNIKWKAEVPGRGSATPIVWGDQVFVATAIPTDREIDPEKLPKLDPRYEKRTTRPTNYYQFVILCFDRRTGKLRWQQKAAEELPHEGHHQTHSYASSSPTTDGKFLYVSFGSFGIYCYDLDGKLQWQRHLGRLNTRLGWGETVTPVIHGDSLLLNWDQEADAALICVDAKTGKTKWKAPRDEVTSWNTPLVVEHKGKHQVIVNGMKRIRSYDLETGKPLWTCGGMTLNAIPSPVASRGVAYIMSGYGGKGGAVAISLDGIGELTGNDKLLWRHDHGTPYVASPALADGRLYFTYNKANLLTVLDAKTGRVLVDRERLHGQNEFYASPTAAAGRVYLVDRAGTTAVIKQGDKFEVLAVNRLDDPIDASPVAVGKQLFLRGANTLYCIEER
jgi:outer membrane protein assembly factor BamB